MSAFGWLVSWILMILLIFTVSRTKAGEVTIYYTAWLLVFLLIVTHAVEISSILTFNQG